jgi:hypothetical protein
MKISVIFMTLWLGAMQLNAQWYQVNTNTTENLYDLFFVDSLEGYCVGGTDYSGTPQSTGVILKTTDGGENWTTIFSLDSITINSIAVVQEDENTRLYAFALKNGNSHLVSTFTNTPFQNWSVDPINYKPQDVQTNDNTIFFFDEVGGDLKKIENSILSVVLNNVVLFGISQDYLFVFEAWNDDSLYYSSSFDSNLYSIPKYNNAPLGQNQSSYATMRKNGDILILKGTYESVVVYSTDNGSNWQFHYGGGEAQSLILQTTEILSLDSYSGKIYNSLDFGQNWNDTTISNVEFISLGYSKYDNSKYAFGKNGVIYKNANLISVGNQEQKKKIDVYPNPAHDILRIDAPGFFLFKSIELYDINGRSVRQFDKDAMALNVGGLPSGTYFLKIETNDGSYTRKVIIE